MRLRTLRTIKCVSAVLGMIVGIILYSVGCQLLRHTITKGWDTAINTVRLSGVGWEHRRLVYKDGGFPDVVIDPEVRREAESGFNIIVVTLAALAAGSFFCFRWAKAEIARTRGSPTAKD